MLYLEYEIQLIKKEFEMLTVRLPEKLESALDKMVKKTGRTKSEYMIKALEQYFERYGGKLDEAIALMKKDPKISFDEARDKVQFWDERNDRREH